MYAFEKTADHSLLQRIMTSDRRVYSGMSDDTCPAMEDFRLPEDDSIWYVLARDDEKLMGFWALIPQGECSAEVHTCILPAYWGSTARRAAREMAQWIWANAPFTKLTTVVPAWHRTALAFARAAGMKEFEVNRNGILKHGTRQDQIMLELSRPTIFPQSDDCKVVAK